MIDVAIALFVSVMMVVVPVWVAIWAYHYLFTRDALDATSNTGATVFGAVVTVFGGFLIVGDQMVLGLGFMGDMLAQFPNLIAYAVLTVGTWLGLAELGEMGHGLAATIALGSVLLLIMIREGASDDE